MDNLPILKDLHIRITSSCNFNCPHCYAADWFGEKFELSIDEIKSLVDQAIELGCKKVTFTGGEPLVAKCIVEAIRYCLLKDLRVEIETNGVLVDKIIEGLEEEEVKKVEFAISYDGVKMRDEKFAKQIARKIEKEREIHPIDTTFQLVDIIKEAIPAYARRKGGHPAKRTFQALRIAVNDELNVFDIALKDALDLLNLNGRISVITFHSLEDKICKYTFNEVSKLKDVPKGLPVIPLEMQPKFKLVNRKPIIASDDELTHNHRAHSAKLRVIERVIL